MIKGELITRSTVWLSILAYTLGSVLFAARGSRINLDAFVRIIWSLACLALIAHFAAAFNFYHGWNQASAYRETARQTAEVFGVNWGGGLFINYSVLVLWIIDVGWWWLRGINSYRQRPLALLLVWHGFLVFIIFNATVVFKDGVQRWLGLVICLLLCLCWWIIAKQKTPSAKWIQ